MQGKTLVILSQVFVPDPASVGQHIADVARELARRGFRVKVYASARGYDDPTRRYPSREILDGVEVVRLNHASFGKRSIFTRVLGSAAFMLQVVWRLLTERNIGAIFFSTSPPLIGIVASIIGRLRGVPIAYWAMDLNPDQLLALGKLKPSSPMTRLLECVNRTILRQADVIFALDRFMADRLGQRMPLASKTVVLPPWPHEDHIEAGATTGIAWPDRRDDNPFRRQHGMTGRFVLMYSGNHSPSNPLDTLLGAMLAFRADPTICFAFVGGGVAKKQVEAYVANHGLTNTVLLPYQPIETLRYSLAAADVHVASLGQDMVGIIHPCKVYGAMAVGRPILFFGPRPSHISDLIDRHAIGWHVNHGDASSAIEAIRAILQTTPEQLAGMGQRARSVITRELSQKRLCSAMCDRLETVFAGAKRPLPPATPSADNLPLVATDAVS